jgi:HD superfamily phosphohydrolase
MSKAKTRTKVIRDPIHGDVSIGPVQRAVIDTDLFQRLRYIRQNGLLHYIFPGAVHTRFAHSIGTMHVAQRVFRSFFPIYRPSATPDDYSHAGSHVTDSHLALHYVGLVFELSALCHDIGHCAFSHSIEQVSQDNFFLPLGDYVGDHMQEYPTLTKWWEAHKDRASSACQDSISGGGSNWIEKVTHEELGMLFVVLVLSPDIDTTVNDTLNKLYENAGKRPTLEQLMQDVLRMVRGEAWLEHSTFLNDQATLLLKGYLDKHVDPSHPADSNETKKKSIVSSFLEILHGLISGNLDVDRFDYLIRDSKYCGTTCGVFDIDLLINSLALRYDENKQILVLCVHERAAQAVEDFLWSRYQFYAQILHHKGNVLLNALFPEAIRIFKEDAQFAAPRGYESFLLFSDDHVLSVVRSGAVKSTKPTTTQRAPGTLKRKQVIVNAFLRKSLPQHLGTQNSGGNGQDFSVRKSELEKLTGISSQNIDQTVVSSRVFKQSAPLPQIIRIRRTNKGHRQEFIEAFDLTQHPVLAIQQQTVHFFELPTN